jgi:DNA-directed RNA polymerase specialized sigma24 family protein
MVVLRDMHDMPYRDLAETLAIPLNTLKPAVHRARERLRQALNARGVRP